MKKILSALVVLGLMGSVLLVPAAGQEPAPAVIPATVQIDDPLNDANALNEQGFREEAGFQGNHVTEDDAGSVSDILKVWFTHDATNVSVNIQTEVPAPASTAVAFNVYGSPNDDWALGCLRFFALIPGVYQGSTTTYQGDPLIKLIDRCNDDGNNVYDNGVEGTYGVAPGPDGTGVLTLSFPRSYSPLLADGLAISKPFVTTGTAFGHSDAGYASPIVIDNTVDGTDYVLTGLVEEPPSGPPWKKGCSKGSPKAKKKGCHKPR